MKRNKLKNLLNRYSPKEPVEIEYKKKTLGFVDAHKNCFERSLSVGHVTASAWLLNKEGSLALLTHHAKLNRWLQLGGHCDGESDVLVSALREAQEESGIQAIVAVREEIFDLDIHLIPGNTKESEHFHYDIRFLLQVVSDEPFRISHESKALRWIGKDPKAMPCQHPSLLRLHNKWLSMEKLFFSSAFSSQNFQQ